MDAKTLHEEGLALFSKRSTLMLLWQEEAENFYPERADFTYQRTVGNDWAGNLATSYPVLCRRDLADQVGTMLRPTQKEWFHMSPTDPSREDNDAKRWLQWAANVMRRAMYDKRSLYSRAVKTGDNDFASFGQAVLTVRMNRDGDRLLYRCYHLRDCAWMEDENGEICAVFRKWKPKARDLKRLFGAKVHKRVDDLLTQNKPFQEIECMHMLVAADMFDGDARGKPWFSIQYDVENTHSMEEVAQWNKEYIIPRWFTIDGSPYAYSPATVIALPEARLLQAMTYTLLEAGEKVTNPPVIATIDAVRSDMAIYAGGQIWVDRDYDERMGDALRPMNIDAKGMPLGIEMQQDSRALIKECFYLNKLSLPQRAPEMTAYEVGQRIQEYIRGALPLFEPMEMDYNGTTCEATFDLMLRNGAFGSPHDMPKSLQGAEIVFRFESPLHDAIGAQKGQKLLEMQQMVASAATMDKNAAAVPDAVEALRDALDGVGTPAKWVRSEVTAKQMIESQQKAEQAQAMLATMQQGGDIAQKLAAARKDTAAAVPA